MIVLESRVISAAWLMMMMMSPLSVVTTAPAWTRVRLRTVWSSIPLRSMVRSVRAMTFMSRPAIHPLAPLSISVLQVTLDVLDCLRELVLMLTQKVAAPFRPLEALGVLCVEWPDAPLPSVVALILDGLDQFKV